MKRNLSDINPYYLAGILDKCMTAVIKENKICFNVRGHRSLVGFFQSVFDSRVSNLKNSNFISLRPEYVYAISDYLKDIPSQRQNVYRIVLEFKQNKESWNSEKNLKDHQKKREEIKSAFKKAYSESKILLPTIAPKDLIPYRAGFIEASYWLGFTRSKARKYLCLCPGMKSPILGHLNIETIYSDEAVSFIEEHLEYMIFRKEVFLKAIETERRLKQNPRGSYFNDYMTLEKHHETSVKLVMALSKSEVEKVIETQRKQKKQERLAAKAAKKEAARIAREKKKEEAAKLRAMRKAERRKQSEAKKGLRDKRRAERRAKKMNLKQTEKDLVAKGFAHCRKCEQVLPLDQFSKAAHIHTGYSLYCKACCKRDHYDKDAIRENSKKWRKKNPDQWRIIQRREKSKPHHRIKKAMKKRINDCLNATRSQNTWRSIVSCTPKELVNHLESQFTPEMSWENYGSFWHIDHIVPCAAFDPTLSNHLKWCWHHKNLRPLKGTENEEKSDILPSGDYASDLKKTDLPRLKEIVGKQLEDMGIATASEFAASWDSPIRINYISI